jgi:hypothetical protein
LASDTTLRQLLLFSKRLLARLLDISTTLTSIQNGIERVEQERRNTIREQDATREKEEASQDRISRTEVKFSEEIVHAYNAQQDKTYKLQKSQLVVSALAYLGVMVSIGITLWTIRLTIWNLDIIYRNQRPWVGVSVTGLEQNGSKSIARDLATLKAGTYDASIEITNFGFAPSQKTSLIVCPPTVAAITADRDTKTLPVCHAAPDQSEDSGPMLFPHQTLTSNSPLTVITRENIDAIGTRKTTLYIMGHITYRDRLSSQDTITHLTNFCFKFVPCLQGQAPCNPFPQCFYGNNTN